MSGLGRRGQGELALSELADLAESRSSSHSIGQLARRLPDIASNEDDASAASLLGQILSLVYPANVADLLSKQILSVFGSLGASLAARLEQLHSSVPHGSEIYVILQSIHRLLVGVLREKIQDSLHIRNTEDLYNYLRLTLSHERSEQVRLLHLSSSNGLIRDELHATGTIDQIAVYPREIVKRSLELNSSALIVVHNHPSGDPTPSADDIDMTRRLGVALKAIGITLHDHVIVGRRECFSFKAERLI